MAWPLPRTGTPWPPPAPTKPPSCGISATATSPAHCAYPDPPHRRGPWRGLCPVRAQPGHRPHRPNRPAVGCQQPRPAPTTGPTLTGHTGAVYGVAFAPDGRSLASASDDETTMVWDLSNRDRPRPLGPPLTG